MKAFKVVSKCAVTILMVYAVLLFVSTVTCLCGPVLRISLRVFALVALAGIIHEEWKRR